MNDDRRDVTPQFHPGDISSAASFDDRISESQVRFSEGTYPKREREKRRKESSNSKKSVDQKYEDSRDDSGRSVLLFPGQGSQFAGMAAELVDVPNVRDMFDRASQILDYDLLRLCLEGPEDRLAETRFCQPAVVVTSLAAVEWLYNENPKAAEDCVALAGFSVGEITALIFSGAITFDDGIHLVKIRGEAMQYCSESVSSGMMSVFFGASANLGLATEVARKWIHEKQGIENPVCNVANFLYSGAKVIAGHKEALDFIEHNKNDFGIRRTKRLPVSGAFHTDLMRPAVLLFKEALKDVTFERPRVPVFSNHDRQVYAEAEDVKKYLPKQICTAVKWEQCMVNIFGKYADPELMPSVYECGPGGQLTAMLHKIHGKAARKALRIKV